VPSPADPTAIEIGSLSIRWYALFILSGIIVAIWLARELARRRGMDPEFILDIAPLVVVSGLIGARVYYVLLRLGYFIDHPSEIINIRLGGMTIHGAIVAGVLMLAYLCHRRRESLLRWTDVIVPGLAMAQAIGRWGNWANQEAFGTPSDLPWAVEISPRRRPDEYPDSATFHQTFLYESIANVLIAAVLCWIVLRIPTDRRLRDGDALWVYLIAYGTVRFFIERIRTDSLYIGPLPAAYWISFVLIAVGVAGLVLGRTDWTSRRADQRGQRLTSG
jgi:phosphatidylglycerol:prolipoprotein diacylglycerol transferase